MSNGLMNISIIVEFDDISHKTAGTYICECANNVGGIDQKVTSSVTLEVQCKYYAHHTCNNRCVDFRSVVEVLFSLEQSSNFYSLSG